MKSPDVEIHRNMRIHMAFNQVPADDNEECKGCWFKDNPFFDCRTLQRALLLPRGCTQYDEDTEETTYLKLEPVKLVGIKYLSQ